jgi:hypothetical protein
MAAASTLAPDDRKSLRQAAIRDLVSVSETEEWGLTDARFGKLTATLVRFIESVTFPEFR